VIAVDRGARSDQQLLQARASASRKQRELSEGHADAQDAGGSNFVSAQEIDERTATPQQEGASFRQAMSRRLELWRATRDHRPFDASSRARYDVGALINAGAARAGMFVSSDITKAAASMSTFPRITSVDQDRAKARSHAEYPNRSFPDGGGLSQSVDVVPARRDAVGTGIIPPRADAGRLRQCAPQPCSATDPLQSRPAR